MTHLLYLDFDGVLNHRRPGVPDAHNVRTDAPAWLEEGISEDLRPRIDKVNADTLEMFLRVTGARVVVHSSWAKYVPLQSLADWLRRYVPSVKVVGQVAEFHPDRSRRIHADALARGLRLGQYVGLDDCKTVRSRGCVWVDPVTGFRAAHAHRAMEILR